MELNEDMVLKAIVENRDEKDETGIVKLAESLSVITDALLPYTKSLKGKGYIQMDLSTIYVTPRTMAEYKKLG